MIDRVKIWNSIKENADVLLEGEISATSFDVFANKCILILEVEFEQYVLSQEQEISNHLEGEKKEQFSDFSTGYLRQMRNWIKDNPITKTAVEVESETSEDKNSSQPGCLKKIIVWVVNIFRRLWDWIKSLFGCSKTQEEINNTCHTEYMKDDFKNRVHSDLDEWIDRAEAESTRIINSFN